MSAGFTTGDWRAAVRNNNDMQMSFHCVLIGGTVIDIPTENPIADSRLLAESARLLAALEYAESALADIGDADREPGDDVAWCESRAAQALPDVRAAIARATGETP